MGSAKKGMDESVIHEVGHLSVVSLEWGICEGTHIGTAVCRSNRPARIFSLVLEWGRVGQRGRRIVEFCPTAAPAKVALECAWQAIVGSSQLFRGRTRSAYGHG